MEALTEEDLALFQSPEGVLFRPPDSGASADGAAPSAGGSKPIEKKKGKKKVKGGGFNAAEDDEWERQVKKDLAEKKKALQNTTTPVERALTRQEKELLQTQTLRREEMARVLRRDLPRALAAARCLCAAVIEVGHATLPALGSGVIAAAVSNCAVLASDDALRKEGLDVLATLSSCVYEVDEVHAPATAQALVASFRSSRRQRGTGSRRLESGPRRAGQRRGLRLGPAPGAGGPGDRHADVLVHAVPLR